MNFWIALDNSYWKKQPLETLLRPSTFPRFQVRPNELPSERAQRWRAEYKDLSEQQNQFILAVVCWAIHDSKGVPSLREALQKWGDSFAANQDLDLFSFRVVAEPREVCVNYKLAGSSRTHQLSVSSSSPSEQEQRK